MEELKRREPIFHRLEFGTTRRATVWRAGFYNMCFLGGIGLRFVLFARTIIGWFIDEPTVLNYGSECLRIVACGFPLYGCGQVLTQSFNGAGDTRTPTRINIFI